MRCLYCGKELPLFKRLRGGEFCSDAHRQSYQEEYTQLALNRLLQGADSAEAKAGPVIPAGKPASAPSKLSQMESPALRRREKLNREDGPAPAPVAAPMAKAASAVETPQSPAKSPVTPVRAPSPVELRPGTAVIESEPPTAPEPAEEAAPAGMAQYLVEETVAAMAELVSVAHSDSQLSSSASPVLPRMIEIRSSDANIKLQPAGRVLSARLAQGADAFPVPSERGLEVREFVRSQPVVEIRLVPVSEIGLGNRQEPLEVKFEYQPPSDAPKLSHQADCDFPQPVVNLGDLARLNFAATGWGEEALSESEREAPLPVEVAARAVEAVAPVVEADPPEASQLPQALAEDEAEPVQREAAVEPEPLPLEPAPVPEPEPVQEAEPVPQFRFEPVRFEPLHAEPPREERARPQPVQFEPVHIDRVFIERFSAQTAAAAPAIFAPASIPVPALAEPPRAPEPVLAQAAAFESAPIVAANPAAEPAFVPDAVTKPLPVTLHGLAPVRGKSVQVFSSGIARSSQILPPPQNSLPLRPLMLLGAAPPAAKGSKSGATDKQERSSSGKSRKADVRVLSLNLGDEEKPEPKADSKRASEKIGPAKSQPADLAPLAKKTAEPASEPAKSEPKAGRTAPQPLAKSNAADLLKPAAPLTPYEIDSMGIPRLAIEADGGFWTKLSTIARIGLAAGVLAAIAGGIFLTSKGSGASHAAAFSETLPEVGSPIPDAGWMQDWFTDGPRSRQPRHVDVLKGSLTQRDYRIELEGQIERQAIGWAFRANNKSFYVEKLAIGGGLEPPLELVRFAVIDGKEQQPRTHVPLPLKVHLDTLYKVRTDVFGSKFISWVQGQKVDEWSDSRIDAGGVGLYYDNGDIPKLGSINVMPLKAR
jgi:hypothetical protein